MKNSIITLGLLISGSLAFGQISDKPVTVRIKKVENINGVETISDTTYTTTESKLGENKLSGGEMLEWKEEGSGARKMIVIKENDDSLENVIDDSEENYQIINSKEGDEKNSITKIIVRDPSSNSKNKNVVVDLDEKATEMQEQIKWMEQSLEESNNDLKESERKVGQAIFIDESVVKSISESGEKKTKIIIIKKVMIVEPDADDAKMLNKGTGLGDGKLELEKINFYPNPGDGKFNLSFDLKEQGNTSINILNMEGKNVYTESLKDFSGTYNKEIDISQNPKGVYFLKVEQGEHAQVKKIILN